MIERTQRKLREVQFFLGELVQEGGRVVRSDPEAFRFYLSALLSAARSVTWALQFEEKDKYDAWFQNWLARRSTDDQEFLAFLKDQRNYEQKRGGAEVSVAWDYIPISRVPTTNRSHPAYGFYWFGPPGTPEPLAGVPVHSFESASGDQDVVVACRRYVGFLSELVRDFLEAHQTNVV